MYIYIIKHLPLFTGDMVSCYYIGKLEDGTVFDQLQPGTKKKRNQPIKFKVGKGNVIRGISFILVIFSDTLCFNSVLF